MNRTLSVRAERERGKRFRQTGRVPEMDRTRGLVVAQSKTPTCMGWRFCWNTAGGLGPHLKNPWRSKKTPPQGLPKPQLLRELLHENLTRKTSSNHRQFAQNRRRTCFENLRHPSDDASVQRVPGHWTVAARCSHMRLDRRKMSRKDPECPTLIVSKTWM